MSWIIKYNTGPFKLDDLGITTSYFPVARRTTRGNVILEVYHEVYEESTFIDVENLISITYHRGPDKVMK